MSELTLDGDDGSFVELDGGGFEDGSAGEHHLDVDPVEVRRVDHVVE